MNRDPLPSADLEEQGFATLPRFTSPETTEELRNALAKISFTSERAEVRDLLRACSRVAALASSPEILDQLSPFTNARPFAVRGILFDKTPEANWLVAWHQDLTIAVGQRREAPGFGPWSVKDGTPHVQPPVELLARMLTVRLHLDDCAADNGALRVLPGSHAHGRLSAEQITEWRARTPEQVCTARVGDALLMRPLLLHASSASNTPKHRRVIHLEFAVDELPDGMGWAERISS